MASSIRRALLSVSDKSGLVELASALIADGVELISTGGTRSTLEMAGLSVCDIAEVTGFPEILNGRVKTLHPHVHAGLLAVRSNSEHMATLAAHKIQPIDLVVVNLYPFAETVAKSGSTADEIIEQIDIGGPTLLRAAAKNYRDVVLLTSPDQYGAFLSEHRQGPVKVESRQKLAAAAFAHVAAYDAAIAGWFSGQVGTDTFQPELTLAFKQRMPLRYGENPHQPAAWYVQHGQVSGTLSNAEHLHGKELSFNNLLDLDAALNLVREFEEPACAVIKHNNPCGAAEASTQREAFRLAYECDPLSAFGGVIAFNRPVDGATAELLTEPNRFLEAIVAPSFDRLAFEIITTRPSWKKNVRLVTTGEFDSHNAPRLDFRRIGGGLLVQLPDLSAENLTSARVVTKRQPTKSELCDLQFAWLVGKHVKSNAIILAKDGCTTGIGAGQMSRIDSVHLAVRKAGDKAAGSALASDAFFPFRDNIDAAAEHGIRAVVQPGGSVRDADSIAACDEHGISMVFTGVRHFRH